MDVKLQGEKSASSSSREVYDPCISTLLGFLSKGRLGQGKKKDTQPPWHPDLSPDPDVTEQKQLWCKRFGKMREKGFHTVGPERVRTTEASDPEKKEGFHGGYEKLFLPCWRVFPWNLATFLAFHRPNLLTFFCGVPSQIFLEWPGGGWAREMGTICQIGVFAGRPCIFLVQKGSFTAISHYVFNECHPNIVLYSIAIFVVRDWPI